MNATVATGGRRVTVEALRLRWGSFLILGLVLIACGITALMLPRISTLAASSVLGGVLIVRDGVKIVQTLKVAGWSGYLWQLMGAAVEDAKITAQGRVREVGAQADPVTRTFKVRLGLDTPRRQCG